MCVLCTWILTVLTLLSLWKTIRIHLCAQWTNLSQLVKVIKLQGRLAEGCKFLYYNPCKIFALLKPYDALYRYDAITTDGKLKWQNRLTAHNKPFLDCCDGMLINYTWKSWMLRETMSYGSGRLADLFLGVDVWGRNTKAYSAGYASVSGVGIAKHSGLSCGIFAPGWVYEKGDDKTWMERSAKFWAMVRLSS